MGDRFQARQSEEATGALDGVQKAENIVQSRPVTRFRLELYQLGVNDIQALGCFCEEFDNQFVHEIARSW